MTSGSFFSRSSTYEAGVDPPGNGMPASLRQRASPKAVRTCHAMILLIESVLPLSAS